MVIASPFVRNDQLAVVVWYALDGKTAVANRAQHHPTVNNFVLVSRADGALGARGLVKL